MRKVIILLFCLVNMMFISSIYAANSTNLKIVVLDVPKLMAKTGYADKAAIELRNKYAARNKELKKEHQALQKEIKEYNKNVDKMAPDEIENWQHKIDAQQRELQEMQVELEQDMMDDQDAKTEKIIASFSSTVEKIALRDNLDLVLFNDVAVYSLGVHDITDEVIELATKKLKPHKKIKKQVD